MLDLLGDLLKFLLTDGNLSKEWQFTSSSLQPGNDCVYYSGYLWMR